MPRPRSVVPMTSVELRLPADLLARVDVLLYSDMEGRVPYGERSKFFERLLRGFFETLTPGDSRPSGDRKQ